MKNMMRKTKAVKPKASAKTQKSTPARTKEDKKIPIKAV
jgi:hypothetical protein